MGIVIPGLSLTSKLPAFAAAVQLGQVPVTPGDIPRVLLVVGTKLTSGSVTPDTSAVQITPASDLNALFGDRSEIAQMIRQAQKIPGVQIEAAPVAEAAGAVSATVTITYTGTASSAGTWRYWVAGELVEVNVATNDTPTQQATKAVAAFSAKALLPVTAASAAGVVTLTVASAGTRGNLWTLYKDDSLKPGTTTQALGSTSAYVVKAGDSGETGVRFGGGTGTDDVSNLQTTLATKTYFTIAVPHVDATNIGRWKTWNAAQAAIGSQRYQSIVCGSNELETTADSIASSTLNDGMFSLVWARGSEDHPGVLAAGAAALFQTYEQQNPNTRFDGFTIPGLHPQRARVDRPTGGDTGEQALRLDSGVTPLTTTDDGLVSIVRAITTFCRKNGQPFYGCIDRGQFRAAFMGAEVVALAWSTEYSPANPYVNSDPAPGEKDRPAGVATPTLWKSFAQGKLAAKIAENWFSSVQVIAEYRANPPQILTSIDLAITPQNHRVGVLVRQVG